MSYAPSPAQPYSKVAGARRFSFDTEFESNGDFTPSPRPKRQFSPEEVEAIRAESYAAGERAATARAQQAHAEAVAALAEAAAAGLSRLEHTAFACRSEAAALALACGRAVAAAALERFPDAAVEATLNSLVEEVRLQPRLLLRARPEQVEALAASLQAAADHAGVPGQILARADAALPPAAFVIDWGDGQAAYDPLAAQARVESALARALAADAPADVLADAPDHLAGVHG